jgi:hypothetical protein
VVQRKIDKGARVRKGELGEMLTLKTSHYIGDYGKKARGYK